VKAINGIDSAHRGFTRSGSKRQQNGLPMVNKKGQQKSRLNRLCGNERLR
jgi:hypothetical protein